MNKVDAIICTYNRPKLCNKLVMELLNCKPKPNNIIVVDSSDCNSHIIKDINKIVYIRSERKSQPYQRYLGAKSSNADICVFFDDDLTVLEYDLFSKICEGFKFDNIVGVGLGLDYNIDTRINSNNRNQYENKSPNFFGKISWLGKTTPLPKFNSKVEYLNGPIMSFKRSIVLKLFYEKLFEDFEKKIMMGEDKIISLRALKYGDLYFFGDKNYLSHPAIESTYYSSLKLFTAKTTYSRFELCKIYAEIKNKHILMAYLFFSVYVIKNLTCDLNNFEKLKGHLKGLSYFFSH